MRNIDLDLQGVKKACGMDAIHLGVVELERDWKPCLEKGSAEIFPYKKRVIVDSGVDIYRPVYFALGQSRCADNHIIVTNVMRFACFTDV